MSATEAPGWRVRLWAVADYLCLAPLVPPKWRGPSDGFAAGHHRFALAMLLLLLGVVALYVVGIAVVTVAIMIDRSWYEDWHIEFKVLGLLRKVFLAWGVFWLFAMGTALLGREAYLPLVWRITRRPRTLLVTAWFWRGLYVFFACVAVFAVHADGKLRQDTRPGKVYILYEDAHRFPRWLFNIGFFPIARAAEQRFGPGEAVMLRVTKDSLHRAAKEATFIFLGTHGMKQGILVPEGFFRSVDILPGEVNPGLQYVYMSGCDQVADWEQAFAPAEVVTFDRLTTVVEHIWWMWFDGPDVVRGLK